jgi:hypothetical protein
MSCSISVHFLKLISVYNVLSNNIVAKQFKRLENRSDQTKTKLLLDGLESSFNFIADATGTRGVTTTDVGLIPLELLTSTPFIHAAIKKYLLMMDVL